MITEGTVMFQQQEKSLIVMVKLLASMSSIIILLIAPFIIWIDVQIPSSWEGDPGLADQSLLTTDAFISYLIFLSVLSQLIIAVHDIIPIIPSHFILKQSQLVLFIMAISLCLSLGGCLFAFGNFGGFADYQDKINNKNAFYSHTSEFEGTATFQLGIGFYVCMIGIILAGLAFFLQYKISKSNIKIS